MKGAVTTGRARRELDLALFTGMGKARNVINVLSADVVVVCGAVGQAQHQKPPMRSTAAGRWSCWLCLRCGVSSSARSPKGWRARATCRSAAG